MSPEICPSNPSTLPLKHLHTLTVSANPSDVLTPHTCPHKDKMKMKHNGTQAALEARSTSSKLATNWEGEKEEKGNLDWSGERGGCNKIENGGKKAGRVWIRFSMTMCLRSLFQRQTWSSIKTNGAVLQRTATAQWRSFIKGGGGLEEKGTVLRAPNLYPSL